MTQKVAFKIKSSKQKLLSITQWTFFKKLYWFSTDKVNDYQKWIFFIILSMNVSLFNQIISYNYIIIHSI